MKMVRKRRLLTFLFFMLISHSEVSTSRRNVSELPENLETLCPYTSFCNKNAAKSFQNTTGEVPCCQPCSCDSTCGLYNNCCYNNLDIYKIEETHQMVCMSRIAIGKAPRSFTGYYRMINKCLKPISPASVSTQIGVGDFYPMYSQKTGFIYFNKAIANCNQVYDTIPFRKAITCSLARNYLSDAARLIRGEEQETGCFLQYLWPSGVDLKSELCGPNVIRKCNVTGTFNKSEPFWKFCEAFNATFVAQKSLKTDWYGNIYCFLCNERLPEFIKFPDKCSALDDISGGSKFGKMSMTAVLDTRIQFNEISTKPFAPGENGCPVNMVMIKSGKMNDSNETEKTTRCRKVLCPSGKIRLDSKCDYHSDQWVGGPFVALFRLTPVQEDVKIPMFVFKEMPEKDRNGRQAKWLKRNTMRNWKFLSLYHPSSDNLTIDFIVCKAIYPSFLADPNAIERIVKTALKDSWQIVHKYENIVLKVGLNDYISYGVHLGEKGMISNVDFAYSPEELAQTESHHEILYQISKFPMKKFFEGIFLTKLFLCEQVDLLAEEFDDHEGYIFFKVTNITLYSSGFRRVEVKTNISKNEISVRICLSKFPPEDIIGSVEKRRLCKICALFVMIHSLYRFV